MPKGHIIEDLRGKNATLKQENRLQEDRIRELKLQLEEYKRMVHGSSSEPHQSMQLAEQLLLDLAEVSEAQPTNLKKQSPINARKPRLNLMVSRCPLIYPGGNIL